VGWFTLTDLLPRALTMGSFCLLVGRRREDTEDNRQSTQTNADRPQSRPDSAKTTPGPGTGPGRQCGAEGGGSKRVPSLKKTLGDQGAIPKDPAEEGEDEEDESEYADVENPMRQGSLDRRDSFDRGGTRASD